MRDQLLGFVDALRHAGLTPSLSESLDAAAAVARTGIERSLLRETLAATLVKDHADRLLFDEVFDRYFALPRHVRAKTPAPRPPGEGEGRGRGAESPGRGDRPPQDGAAAGDQPRGEREHGERPSGTQAARALAARRALMQRPFRDMDGRDVEALPDLLAALSRRLRVRWSRRIARAARGRLDLRRTIRRALSRGGVPLELLHRAPRPGKADLVALVDLSFSTATAAEFLLALLLPARGFFRRVNLLAYVDRPVPVSFEGGHVVPHEPLDFNARSDFGAVLRELAARPEGRLGRNTVLLVLGDARNNRRPPRADLLCALHDRARSVVWLNPEQPARWNTGDSVIAAYQRHCDALLAAWSPATLVAAVDDLLRH